MCPSKLRFLSGKFRKEGLFVIPANVTSNPFSLVSKALGDSKLPKEWDRSIASFGGTGLVKGIGGSEGFGRSNAFWGFGFGWVNGSMVFGWVNGSDVFGWAIGSEVFSLCDRCRRFDWFSDSGKSGRGLHSIDRSGLGSVFSLLAAQSERRASL